MRTACTRQLHLDLILQHPWFASTGSAGLLTGVL
jgi:hypothetical protein